MRIRNAVRAAGLTAGLMTMAVVLVPGTASAQTTANLCALRATTVTPAGDNKEFTVYATTPPQASEPEVAPKDLYPDGKVRLGSSLGFEIVTPYGYKSRRYLVLGTDMYASGFTTDGGPAPTTTRCVTRVNSSAGPVPGATARRRWHCRPGSKR
jgi:hypothetical protein